jgi:hypothetical protein
VAAGYAAVFTAEAILFGAAAVLVVATVQEGETRGLRALQEAGQAMATGG